jgi:hypothetical protein
MLLFRGARYPSMIGKRGSLVHLAHRGRQVGDPGSVLPAAAAGALQAFSQSGMQCSLARLFPRRDARTACSGRALQLARLERYEKPAVPEWTTLHFSVAALQFAALASVPQSFVRSYPDEVDGNSDAKCPMLKGLLAVILLALGACCERDELARLVALAHRFIVVLRCAHGGGATLSLRLKSCA